SRVNPRSAPMSLAPAMSSAPAGAGSEIQREMASAMRSSDALPWAAASAASAHMSATGRRRELFMREMIRSAGGAVEWRALSAERYYAPLNVHADSDEVRRSPGL